MASLTSARARNRGASAAVGHANGSVNHRIIDNSDDEDKSHHYSDEKKKTSSVGYNLRSGGNLPAPNGASPALGSPFTPPLNSSRQFGSDPPATSGWVTSDSYANQKGSKGKLRGAKLGTGPLRDYGGGLGSIGQGEFKLLLLITLLASVVRLWRLDRPTSVVFDEVHFGGFATKYMQGKFFMDVHPPLAKLMITFSAWFSGYKANFDFKDIGKEYGPDHVPYIAMRLLPASLGVALVPISYLTLRSLGCRAATALLAALLITFENGLITQSRFILLDSPLVFFTSLTVFFWVGFTAEDGRKAGSSQQGPFSLTWWSWLALTGTCLGATFSCKWVGLFTIATIGLATIEQLWQILGDTKVPMRTLGRHFVARAICLIFIPSVVYMFWFAVHFLVLGNSGDGDGFMSSEFQHTLRGHGMPNTYADVALGSRISIKHLNTQGGYLHSHLHAYPGGSKQQQITLYPHRDENNDWIVLNETQQIGKPSDPQDSTELTYLTDKMFVRFHHAITNKKLHSHDVRPPVSEVDFQNEVSAYGFADFEGDANDNFQVEILQAKSSGDKYAKKRVRALRTKFRLRHVLTGCYLFSHRVKLPDWGFEQQEVTCNKNPTMANSVWYVETSTHPHMPKNAQMVNYRKPGFFSKFTELQGVMWRTNAGLTDRHAYDSRPHQWPYLRRGINFWVKDHRQIYLLGNPVTWWLASCSVILYGLSRGFLILRQKRGYQDLNNTTVQYYDRLCGFLFIGWALHYFPFFIMQRQLFLHHYFPALYFSILLLASVFDLATSTLKPKIRVQIAAIVLICALWSYVHWSPLTYAGKWTRGACEDAKWLKHWDFACGDFHDHYAEYDQVAVPTPSKPVVVDEGVPPVEAETPSSMSISAAVQPAKNAFAEEHNPPPAPKSSYLDAQDLAKVEQAQEEAEKKEEQEHPEIAAVRESEPTNVPGAELPVSVVAERIKEEVIQQNAQEAQLPLEQAAPSPSESTDSVANAAPPSEVNAAESNVEISAAASGEGSVASSAASDEVSSAAAEEAISGKDGPVEHKDTQQLAGERLQRLAKIDAAEKEAVAGRVRRPQRVDADADADVDAPVDVREEAQVPPELVPPASDEKRERDRVIAENVGAA